MLLTRFKLKNVGCEDHLMIITKKSGVNSRNQLHYLMTTCFLCDISEATLVADVNHVINKANGRRGSNSRRGSAIFDPTKYPQLDEETFTELRKAFLVFDKESTG